MSTSVYTTQTPLIRQESSLGPVVILMRTGLFELPNAALSGRGERMRASGPLQREVRRPFALL